MATPNSYQGIVHDRGSSSGTSDEQTLEMPRNAQAMIVTVETTSARVTFDGTTPSATNGIIIPKDGAPLYLPFATDITWLAATAAASVVNVIWLF